MGGGGGGHFTMFMKQSLLCYRHFTIFMEESHPCYSIFTMFLLTLIFNSNFYVRSNSHVRVIRFLQFTKAVLQNLTLTDFSKRNTMPERFLIGS